MTTIGPTTEKLWRQYLDAEKNRVRLVMLPALERFIDELLAESKGSWQQWALDIAIQVSDEGALDKIIDEVLAKNPTQVAQFKEGKQQVLGFLVGQVMKASGGKANPGKVNELLKKKLG